jgi:hypothetical protein
MAATQGVKLKLGIDSANPVTKRFDVLSESIRNTTQNLNTNGLRGSLDGDDISRVVQGLIRIGGGLSLQPNPVEMALLLPWILGTAGSGSGPTTYALSDSTLTRYVAIYRGAGNLFTYAGCAVDRATFRGSPGAPIALELDIVGQTETVSGSFPSINIDVASGPFMFFGLTLTIGGTAYACRDFDITISNGIDRERFLNSQTLTDTVKQNRQITLNASIPWAAATALHNQGATGVAVTAAFAVGASTLTFTMSNVAFDTQSPTVGGRTEPYLTLPGTAYSDQADSLSSLVVTL